MSDYDISYFQKINAEEGEQAQRLADVLVWKYAPLSVLDIGCATGLYLKPFLDKGIQVNGVDYSDSVIDQSVLQIPRKLIQLTDITKSPIGRTADLALCIEVLEHIAAEHAQAAIKHLIMTSKLIIFSAAQPGQGGVGHINCQPKQYWEELFAQHSLKREHQDEEYIKTIMQAGYHMGWLTNNLMIFKKI